MDYGNRASRYLPTAIDCLEWVGLLPNAQLPEHNYPNHHKHHGDQALEGLMP